MPGDRWLVAGLGNSGPQYTSNRHNVGALCCDELAADTGAGFKRDKSRAMVASATVDGAAALLVKPLGFMNESGRAVASLRSFYKLPDAQIVVLHDELDLAFGAIRVKLGGGDNGHNGLRSVTAALRTKEYFRVRIGIGRPPGRMEPATYVLRDFSAAQRTELPLVLDRAAAAVRVLLTHGLAAAQDAVSD
ncbi:MAG TPA: aminoacyl-tRNA hydrolase [Streptosporangiaceae bacterium]|jgi:PTH1 family peptidyl-tRNA hydrolase